MQCDHVQEDASVFRITPLRLVLAFVAVALGLTMLGFFFGGQRASADEPSSSPSGALSTTVSGVTAPIVTPVVAAVTPAVTPVTTAVAPILTPVTGTVAPVTSVVAPIVSPVVGTVSGAVSPIIGTVPGVVSPIRGTLQTVTLGGTPPLGATPGSIGVVRSPSSGGLGTIVNQAVQPISTLVTAVVAQVGRELPALLPWGSASSTASSLGLSGLLATLTGAGVALNRSRSFAPRSGLRPGLSFAGSSSGLASFPGASADARAGMDGVPRSPGAPAMPDGSACVTASTTGARTDRGARGFGTPGAPAILTYSQALALRDAGRSPESFRVAVPASPTFEHDVTPD